MRAVLTHVEHLAQLCELRLIREELAPHKGTLFVHSLEELEAEHVLRSPVLHGVSYHHGTACVGIPAKHGVLSYYDEYDHCQATAR